MKRRALLTTALATPFIASAETTARVVVIGGGFGGATAARFLLQFDPRLDVTLIETSPTFTACPFSNAVLVGQRGMDAQRFTYKGVAASGVRVVHATASAIDHTARTITLDNGTSLPWDRLILSPGIDIAWDALPGYNEAAAERMPHAWKAGPQTILLKQQLDTMADDGTVVMSVPANPYRCPPGPYERASLIAWYLKTHKPRARILVLDAKDVFSKQKLFQDAWAKLYPETLRWVGLSDGGKVTRADPAAMTVETDFATYKADVINIIPPQRAGRIAVIAGTADKSGWCPIDPVSFESRLVPNIHVIGDAAIAGAMPKSAFAANAQAKACALGVARLLNGEAPGEPRLINTCYSLIAPEYGISVAGVYRPANGVLADIEGAGGTSPLDAPDEQRHQEATYAEAWFQTIGREVFG